MRKELLRLVACVTLFALHGSFAIAADAVQSATAEVAYIEGSARVFGKDKPAGRNLKQGDLLGKEDEVRVGERSRVEIRFPDGTLMRLSEKSRLSMSELKYDTKTQGKNVKVKLGLGKLWANVKKLATPDSSVEVKISNAVAGVRGTVYRVNVEEDNSAMVKVYDGSVYVASSSSAVSGGPPVQVAAPVPVPGPHEVPPPVHQVTMEEWHVIVKAMQQITISAQGVASQPRDFDAKADVDDWVKWNQERDRQSI